MHWGLLAFVGLSAANWPGGYEKEYTYHYTSAVLTGIPELGSQYAGLRIGAVIKMQKYPDDTFRFQLQDSKFQAFNKEFAPGMVTSDGWYAKNQDMEDMEDVNDVPSHIKTHLEAPFKVFLKDGYMEKIQVEDSEPEYITNIKKALISLAGIMDAGVKEKEERSKTGEFVSTYKRMETSIVGECETYYTINKLPEHLGREFEERERIPVKEVCAGKAYYEVVATKDLKNCRERPIFHSVIGANAVSDGSLGSTSPFASEDSVTRSIICGTPDNHLHCKTINTHVFLTSPSGKFESREKMVVSGQSIVSFRSIEDKVEDIADVKSPKPARSLMYEIPSGHPIDSTTSTKSSILNAGVNANINEWQRPQAEKPDMVSSPVVKTAIDLEDQMNMLVDHFIWIMENADQTSDVGNNYQNIADRVAVTSYFLSSFGAKELKSLWTKIEVRFAEDIRPSVHGTFLDLVSMCGTNPCIGYVIEMVKSDKLVGESGAWIVSNAIRSTRYPTEELLMELTNLLRNNKVQADRNMFSTIALSLTHLMNKACIDETSSVYDYPVKVYGRFCNEKSPVITRELLPFLAEKLFAADETDLHMILTCINALGNLGHDGAALHLLKAIEGEPTLHPHPRSVAVYQLIKSAATKPGLYRPIILSIIEDIAESPEVRMAAVTVLPYTWPDNMHWNKLALRTWWEPSKQVASYIHSTLKTLSELPTHSRLYTSVNENAQWALKLAKPADTGIQTSHNIMISHFLDSLKAAVNVKLQYVTSEESAFPRNIFFKKAVSSKSHATNNLELSVYMQGAEYFINKMYEAYSSQMTGEAKQNLEIQQNYIKNIINVESRWARKPEAHITVKMMGLQRLFTIDNKMVEEIIGVITKDSIEALRKDNTLSREFMKIVNLNGHDTIIPTECGLPVFFHHMNPLIISGKASVNVNFKDMTKGEVGLTMKPVVNYKQITVASVMCPFTGEYIVTGVNQMIHVDLPVRAEINMHDGHYSVAIKTPNDHESQTEKPVMKLTVKPYTGRYNLADYAKLDYKIIKSRNPMQRKHFNVGRPLGLDLNLVVETEHPMATVTELMASLKEHTPLTLLTLALPLKTVRDHTISLIYNPRGSVTKEASLMFSYGYGNKEGSTFTQPDVTTSSSIQVPPHVMEKCTREAEDWLEREEKDNKEVRKEQCTRKHMDICMESRTEDGRRRTEDGARRTECRTEALAKCEEEVERVLTEETEERKEECEREAVASEEKTVCLAEQSRQSRPTHEVESYCNKVYVKSEARHSACVANRKSAGRMLSSIAPAGQAITVNVQAALHGEDYTTDQKIQTQITLAERKRLTTSEEGMAKLAISVRTPDSHKPFEVEMESTYLIKRPSHAWDMDAMLREDLTSRAGLNAVFGWRDAQKDTIDLAVTAERSAELRTWAMSSTAWTMCQSDLARGLRLAPSCKDAQELAASLDIVQTDVSLPKAIALSPYVTTLTGMVRAYYLPYLTVESSDYNRQSANHEHYRISAKISPLGRTLTVGVAGNTQKTVVKDLRLVHTGNMLPICVKDGIATHMLEKATRNGAPSTCSVEGNKVSTFDKVVYDYTLNDCEHVIFKDCSASPKVLVTVRKTPVLHIVKAVIDNNKFEIELVKAGSRSHSAAGKVKVNGVAREVAPGTTLHLEDAYTKVSMFEDGVYKIVSMKYGMAVLADREATEVKTYQHALRNLACGLCGDLNDEKTADIKSADQCVMSSPKLAAYSYMVQDHQCAGIPTADLAVYHKETNTCVKKETVPTKVMEVFNYKHINTKRNHVFAKHMVVELGQKICLCKEQIAVCGADSQPTEYVRREMDFFCVPRDREGAILARMAHMGERIVNIEKYPTEYTHTVYEARSC